MWCIAQCHDINSASLTTARSLLLGLKSLGPTPRKKCCKVSGASRLIHAIFTHISGAQKLKPPSLDTSESGNHAPDSQQLLFSPSYSAAVGEMYTCNQLSKICFQRYLVHLSDIPFRSPVTSISGHRNHYISTTGQLWLRDPEAMEIPKKWDHSKKLLQIPPKNVSPFYLLCNWV